MNDLSFVKKLTSDKRRFIYLLLLLLIVIVIYCVANTIKVNYSVEIDKGKSTKEYSRVEINATLIKLPFNYLMCYGNIIVDDIEMKIGRVGSVRFQVIKDDRKNDIYMNFYNPKYYTEDYTDNKLNISIGTLFLVKSERDFKYSYTDIVFYRPKLSTTITETFMISGDLVSIR